MANSMSVFISYARQDLTAARRLYFDLKRLGVEAWLDVECLLPGQRWKFEITRAIREARFFIAVLSAHAVSKRGVVQSELRQALSILDEYPDNDVFIIPVRVDECVPSDNRLKDLNWVDLFPSYEAGFERIKNVVLQAAPDLQHGSHHPAGLGFYIYVSDSKLAMLSSQIPRQYLLATGAELDIDPQVFAQPLSQAAIAENRYAVAAVLTRYLESHSEIGTCDLPRAYFAGDLPMKWGEYQTDTTRWGEPSPLVYFGGETEKTIVGLGGSAHHVIGAMGRGSAHSHSATPFMVAKLYEGLEMSLPPDDEIDLARARSHFQRDDTWNIAMAVDLATEQMRGSIQNLSFVARNLAFFPKGQHEAWRTGMNIILGTPLWVRLADK
jgi:hypothetical protein